MKENPDFQGSKEKHRNQRCLQKPGRHKSAILDLATTSTDIMNE